MKRSSPKRPKSSPNWKNKSHARKFMMAAKALFQLLLIALFGIMTIYSARASNISRQLVNADIISLKEYGFVFKPGRLMSTSDVTHIQQGFVIEIPRRMPRTDKPTAAEALYDRVSRTILGTTSSIIMSVGY